MLTADHSFDMQLRGGRLDTPLLDGLDDAEAKAAEAEAAGENRPTLRTSSIRMENGHTGEPVIVAAKGPGAERVRGFMLNTDLFTCDDAGLRLDPHRPRASPHRDLPVEAARRSRAEVARRCDLAKAIQKKNPSNPPKIADPRIAPSLPLCYDHWVGWHRATPSSHLDAGWSSLVARWAHNPKVVGSNPTPATTFPKHKPPKIDSWDKLATIADLP